MPADQIYRVSPRDLVISRAGAWLVFFALACGVLAGILPPKHGTMTRHEHVAFGVCTAALAYAFLLWAVRWTHIRFGDATIRLGAASRRSGSTCDFPVADVVRFEVRRWSVVVRHSRLSERLLPEYHLSMLVRDGTWVRVGGFSRAPGFGGARRTLLGREAGSRPARAVRARGGRRLVWTEDNDAEVEAYFNARLGERRALTDAAPTGVITWAIGGARQQLAWDAHRRQPPAAPVERRHLSEAINGRVDPPIVPPADAQLPPRPRVLDAAPAATLPEVALPTRFWTLASARAGHIFGRRSSMLIAADGITFERRLRRDLHVPVSEIDRFDTALDTVKPRDPWDDEEQPLPGKWRLLLFRRDGTTVPLSGLNHGYFNGNQLYWATGETAGRVGTPTGSMPWPNDQPLLVAARLNAHLNAARGAASS